MQFSTTHPVVALEQNLLGLVPVSALLGILQVRAMTSVQILEDAVLVLETSICPHGRSILHCCQGPLRRPVLGGSGCEAWAGRRSR